MLILQSLTRGARHGYGIAQHIQEISDEVLQDEVLQVEEGSLYPALQRLLGKGCVKPALQRLLVKGWVKAEWGTSDNNRRARYYTLTSSGKKQLGIEAENFERMIRAIARVMQTA